MPKASRFLSSFLSKSTAPESPSEAKTFSELKSNGWSMHKQFFNQRLSHRVSVSFLQKSQAAVVDSYCSLTPDLSLQL